MNKQNIKIDDLSDVRIEEFLNEHIEDMKAVSPPESKHALDLEGLKKPDVTFWSVWESEVLIGCGALKELSDYHAEIKSMRVITHLRGKGVASNLLSHIINEAAKSGYHTLSLETGSMPFSLQHVSSTQNLGSKYASHLRTIKKIQIVFLCR